MNNSWYNIHVAVNTEENTWYANAEDRKFINAKLILRLIYAWKNIIFQAFIENEDHKQKYSSLAMWAIFLKINKIKFVLIKFILKF